jgi:hypothetical protein
MLPANSAMRIEPMRLAMNASHYVAPLRCDDGLATIYITWEAVSAESRRINSEAIGGTPDASLTSLM